MIDEFQRPLFSGPIWWLNSRYLLSCLVLDAYIEGYVICIVVVV